MTRSGKLLALALFLSIVGVGVVLRRKMAILAYKVVLWVAIGLLLSVITNPHVVIESRIESFSLSQFYCISALALAACSSVQALIVVGEKLDKE